MCMANLAFASELLVVACLASASVFVDTDAFAAFKCSRLLALDTICTSITVIILQC